MKCVRQLTITNLILAKKELVGETISFILVYIFFFLILLSCKIGNLQIMLQETPELLQAIKSEIRLVPLMGFTLVNASVAMNTGALYKDKKFERLIYSFPVTPLQMVLSKLLTCAILGVASFWASCLLAVTFTPLTEVAVSLSDIKFLLGGTLLGLDVALVVNFLYCFVNTADKVGMILFGVMSAIVLPKLLQSVNEPVIEDVSVAMESNIQLIQEKMQSLPVITIGIVIISSITCYLAYKNKWEAR